MARGRVDYGDHLNYSDKSTIKRKEKELVVEKEKKIRGNRERKMDEER